MARWSLECTDCRQPFTYKEILGSEEQRPLDPFLFWSGPKPEFPNDGAALACPNCGKSSTYQRHQLIFYPS